MNLDVLCGTSVECEQLFSAAKNILTDTRKKISPAVFQDLLLLKVNRKEWDVYTVIKVFLVVTVTAIPHMQYTSQQLSIYVHYYGTPAIHFYCTLSYYWRINTGAQYKLLLTGGF